MELVKEAVEVPEDRTITVTGKGHSIQVESKNYPTLNGMIVDLSLAIKLIEQSILEQSRQKLLVPGLGSKINQ